MLRDQLYPVKVDNANRSAVLNQDGEILPGAAETLGKGDNVSIAKIAWLSNKGAAKAYGSMVIYLTTRYDYYRSNISTFDGEPAYTKIYERWFGPNAML